MKSPRAGRTAIEERLAQARLNPRRRLLAPIASSSFTGSYVAPMALLNGLLLACAQLTPRRSLQMLRQSEKDYLSGPRWYEQAPVSPAQASPRRRARK